MAWRCYFKCYNYEITLYSKATPYDHIRKLWSENVNNEVASSRNTEPLSSERKSCHVEYREILAFRFALVSFKQNFSSL